MQISRSSSTSKMCVLWAVRQLGRERGKKEKKDVFPLQRMSRDRGRAECGTLHVKVKKSVQGSTSGFKSLRMSAETIVHSRDVQIPYYKEQNKVDSSSMRTLSMVNGQWPVVNGQVM